MGPVQDLKERKETTMEASTSIDRTAFVSMLKDESKHEGKGVSVMNCTKDDEGGSAQPRSNYSTASSSSFGDTFSDYGTFGCESDNEVISDLRVDAAPLRGFGGSVDLFPLRKKRVTSHWRKFVQPIKWRCKWVELQLRKFESMAIMYDRKIEKHKQTKQLRYRNFELEGHCARSMPFVHGSQRQKLMERKIRRRRDESDTELYMLHHNISSYLATCRSPAHGPTMDDDETNLGPSSPKNSCNEFRVPDELLSFDFRDGYSLEQILWKIEVSQSQVSKMKDTLYAVMTDNAGSISATEDLILQESNIPLTPQVVEPCISADMEGPSIVATFASQLMKLNTGHDVKPDIAAPEVTNLQDANEPMEQPRGASRKRSSDGILMYNRRTKKRQTDSETMKIHPTEKLWVSEDEKKTDNTAPVSVSEDSSQNEQPAPKIRSISKLTTQKNTEKRVARPRRKRGSSLWSRRTSG